MTTTLRELTEQIREGTGGLPLSGLIVFGSRAWGAEHPGSDLELPPAANAEGPPGRPRRRTPC